MAESDVRTLGYRVCETFNARDIDAAEELFAPDFVRHAAGTVGGLRTSLTSIFMSQPNIRLVIEDVLVEGDKFALRMTVHGIPHAPEGPLPTMIEFFRTENGRVVEVWSA